MIALDTLDSHLFTVSDLFAVRQEAPGKTRFIPQQPRPTDALLLFAGTVGTCYQPGKEPLYIPQGSLVYMPRGSYYIWENEPAGETRTQEQFLLEFTLHDIGFRRSTDEKRAFFPEPTHGKRLYFSDEVRLLTTRHTEEHKRLFAAVIEAFERADGSPLALYSAVYALFAAVARNVRPEESSDSVGLVRRSLALLEDSSFDGSIADVAARAHVSVAYFERLFRREMGVTPGEYRRVHRLGRIKLLLRNDHTLEQIAADTGFCDSGYLCRFFKKQTGLTPSEYRRMYKNQIGTFSVESSS